MTGKIIRILFISLLLGVNAIAYYLYLSPNEPKHLSYLPENALMVFSLNTKELSGKLAYSALFNEEEFVELIEDQAESDISWKDNINSGIKLYGRITFMLLPHPNEDIPFSCMLMDLSSKTQLEKVLKKDENDILDLNDGLHYAQTSDHSVLFFNDEIVLFITNASANNELLAIASDLFSKKNVAVRPYIHEENRNKDFTMLLQPKSGGLKQMPFTSKAFSGLITELFLSGEFSTANIDLNLDVVMDTSKISSLSEFFYEHNRAQAIPEELQEGILNFHTTFTANGWVDWFSSQDFIPMPDSIKTKFYSGIKNEIGHHFVLKVNDVKLMRLDFDSTKNGMKTYPVPEFTASLGLNSNTQMNRLFESLHQDSIVQWKQDYYSYTTDFGVEYRFKVTDKALCFTTGTEFILNPQEETHGFSNWFYFNAENYIDQIPGDNPSGFMIKEVMQMVNSVHYGYAYSVACTKNKWQWEAKLFYNDEKRHSLIETIKFMQKMAGLFVM